MKLLLSVLLGFILQGCSTTLPPRKSVTNVKAPKSKSGMVAAKGGSSKDKETVWELLSHSQITLKFRNLDNNSNLSINLQKGLTYRSIPKGHWELTGFFTKGKSFASMNTSKKFVLLARPKNNTYAGSIVIGCPSIASVDFNLLKGMSFFNRYPFSSKDSLCEMAIGSDLKNVRSTFRKLKKSNKLNLTMGF